MKTFELTLKPARAPTEHDGWHLAWPHCSRYPLVFWAKAGQTEWRHGAQLMAIDAWAGPLPERKV